MDSQNKKTDISISNIRPMLQHIKKDIQGLENERKHSLIKYNAAKLIIVCYIIFVICMCLGKESDFLKQILALSFIILNFLFFILMYIKGRYENFAKHKILISMLSYFGNFEYSKSSIDNNNFKNRYINNLKLFEYQNIYSVDDRIRGLYGEIFIDIAEINNYEKKGIIKTENRIGKNALFIRAESPKNYEGITIITTQSHYKNMQEINLESVDFSKMFKVYSTDQIEARYLLTTAFMERLMEISKKEYVDKLHVSFEQNSMNIFIESSKDWFEIPINKSLDNMLNLRQIVDEFIIIIKLANTLKLEQNIGI